MLDLLVTAIILATLGAYVWSASAHFRSDRLEAGAKLIAVMVFGTATLYAWLIWSVEQNRAVQLAGLAIQCLAFALFWWTIAETRKARLLAAFTDGDPQSLITTGPYRYVRHPFYTSYILFWCGGALATGVWWTVLPAAIMITIYRRAAAQEEARFGNTDMAEAYAAFARDRSRFFPGLF